MKMLKAILRQGVDLILLFMTVLLLILYIINEERNYTGFLIIMIGYISFNIFNKAILSKKEDENINPRDR